MTRSLVAYLCALVACAFVTVYAFADPPQPDKAGDHAGADKAVARAQVEDFLRKHTARVPQEDLIGYLSDILPDHGARPVLKAYLERVFRDFDFSAEIESFEVEKLLTQTAHIKVVQRTLRTETASGAKFSERAEIRYILRRPNAMSPWRIEHTERVRLDDQTTSP